MPTHVGDLAWWLHRDLWKRQLWPDGDRCVAWGWLHRPAALDYEVHRAHRGGALHREVLEWFQSEVEGTEPLDTYAFEGR